MKKLLSIFVVVALAAALVPAAFAQDQSSPNSPNSSGYSTSPSDSTNSFMGTIVKASGKFVLKTENGTYQLDDQQKAKQFQGKQVKVSGSLDKATSILHVTDITPAS